MTENNIIDQKVAPSISVVAVGYAMNANPIEEVSFDIGFSLFLKQPITDHTTNPEIKETPLFVNAMIKEGPMTG